MRSSRLCRQTVPGHVWGSFQTPWLRAAEEKWHYYFLLTLKGTMVYLVYNSTIYFYSIPDRGFALSVAGDVDYFEVKNVDKKCENFKKMYSQLREQAERQAKHAEETGETFVLAKDFSMKDEFLKEMSQLLTLTVDELRAKVPGTAPKATGGGKQPSDLSLITVVFQSCTRLAQYYEMYDLLDHMAQLYEKCHPGARPPAIALEGRTALNLARSAFTLDTLGEGNKVSIDTMSRAANTIDSLRTKADVVRNGHCQVNDLKVTPLADRNGKSRAVIFEDENSKNALVLCTGYHTNSVSGWARYLVDARKGNLDPTIHNPVVAQCGHVHKVANDVFEGCWADPKFPERLRSEASEWDVSIVGQSVAGSLAQVFGSAFANASQHRVVKTYTVGAPRVFTQGSARALEVIPNLTNYRVCNLHDSLPNNPSTRRKFQHAGIPLPIFLPQKVSDNLMIFEVYSFCRWHHPYLYERALSEDDILIQTTNYNVPRAGELPKYQ